MKLSFCDVRMPIQDLYGSRLREVHLTLEIKMARVNKAKKNSKKAKAKAVAPEGGVKKAKAKTKTKTVAAEGKKTRRYKRDVKGYREYRALAKYTGTLNAAAPVSNITRQIAREVMPDVRITSSALNVIHGAIESYIHELSRDSKNISSGQHKVQTSEDDVALAFELQIGA